MNRKIVQNNGKHPFQDRSILVQFALVSVTLLLLVMGITLWALNMIAKLSADNLNSRMTEAVRKDGAMTDQYLEKVESLFTFILAGDELESYLLAPVGDHYLELYNYLSIYQRSNLDIKDVALYSEAMHYSSVFTPQELDGLCQRIQSTGVTNLGLISPSVARDTKKSLCSASRSMA